MRSFKIKKQVNKIRIIFSSLIVLAGLISVLLSAHATATKASTDDQTSLSKLVTHGYALGVASNFNVFATEQFLQSGAIKNARIAAGNFSSQAGNTDSQTIGWQSPSSKVDPHILVVGTLNDDYNTRTYTTLDTDATEKVFAAETNPDVAEILKNRKGMKVQTDPLTSVKDFSETLGTSQASFANAKSQLTAVSDFYRSATALQQTFSKKYLQITDVADNAYLDRGGVSEMITDGSAAGHGLQVINLNTNQMTGTGGIKTDTGILNLNFQIKTNRTTEPIVIINFANLTGTLDLNSLSDKIKITYGPTGTEHSLQNKHNILLNLPKISEVKLMNTFVGTFLAPQADLEISSLNTSISAVAARKINLGNAVETEGSDGVFNPDEFRNPDNSAENEIKNSVKSTVTQNSNQTKDFSTANAEFNNLKYNDILHFNIEWSGYKGSSLYKSNDNKNWVKVDQGITTDSEGINKYHIDEDIKSNSEIKSQNDGNSLIYTLNHPVNSYQYALFTEDPNVNNIKAEWQSGVVSTNFANFNLSIPSDLVFSEFKGVDTNGLLKFEPKNTNIISFDNQFDAPFKLSVQALRSSIEPNSNDNVFTNSVSKFNYVSSDNEDHSLLDDNGSQPVIVLDEPTLPTTNFNLSTFKLNIPAAMRFNKSKIVLDWKLSLGG